MHHAWTSLTMTGDGISDEAADDIATALSLNKF